MENMKKQTFKEWYRESWGHRFSCWSVIIAIIGLSLTLIIQKINTPMWKQLEIYADKHYSIFQDIEPLYPSDSNQMYFYKEALLAKKDYQSLKSCLENVKHLGEEESLKDANAICKLSMTLGQTITASNGIWTADSRLAYLIALKFPALNQSDTGLTIDPNYRQMEENFNTVEQRLFDVAYNNWKKFEPIAVSAVQHLNDIYSNNENGTEKINRILNETFGSEEYKNYIKSMMAYLENKYLTCCMVLRLTYSNSYEYISQNISNNK